ncbi:multidrug efflux MFS transporter [Streptococcus himalayensis]|uniref:MFS transporter n=1 Tax=Streptococcus himalayensis TaxID=1888195 RepID=A0A917EE83_9STRE|nr:multidrug efflux MFS transporter [Streptococcus himalayensis]GGE27630.1 MFS transporter [Streptococcus himalayensis]
MGASFSMVMPFISVFVEELGTPKNQVEFYAGLAVSTTALASAIMSPIWGSLADRYGRKPMMVRASSVMVVTMGGLAFVPNVFWLIFLRILTGVFAGYVPNSTALIASQVPKEKTGYALGTLSTGLVAGTLIGPLMGGFLAEVVGMHWVFLIVGFLLFLVTLLTFFNIKEDFRPIKAGQEMSLQEVFHQISNKQIVLSLFVTSMIIQMAAQSVVPILTLYIRHLGQRENLLFVSGMIISALGFSSMFSSPVLGKWGDKIGNHRLLLMALLYSFIMNWLNAHATTPLQLGIFRFFYGFGTGALLPSVNSLLAKLTPKEGISRIFSFNQTFIYMGSVLGPMLGSAVASYLGYSWVFYVTAYLVLANFIWSLWNFKNYLKVREI